MSTRELEACSLSGVTVATITDALRDAVADSDVEVTAAPEYDGAILTRCCVSVYVLLNQEPVELSVECCHRSARDAYKVESVTTLGEAVELAMAEFDNV